MKILFIIFLIFSHIPLTRAQTPTETDYCPALQQLEGEWKYQNGQDRITIFLRYHRMISRGVDHATTTDRIFDALIGWVEYKQGNTIIQSTYQNRNMSLPYSFHDLDYNTYSILLSFTWEGCGSNDLIGIITDFGHHNQLDKIKATLINNGTQIIWRQAQAEFNGAFNGDYGMTLPGEFTLTKQ